MTTELEEQFYKTFGIEPKIYKTDGRDIDDNGDVCSWYIEEVYPEITDRKLLELICILNETACEILSAKNKEDLKNEILETCIKVYDTPIITSDGDEYDNYEIYDKIQALFRRRNNDRI